MAISKPRVLYSSLLYNASLVGGVWCSHEDTAYPGENAANWRMGEVWTPDWSVNLLTNGGGVGVPNPLLTWTAGASSAPDDWVLAGAGATIARDSTNFYAGTGPYGAAITRAGADVTLTNTITSNNYRRLKVTVGGWAKCATASVGAIRVADSVGTLATSSYCGSDWTWVTATGTVAATATSIKIVLLALTSDATVYFSGVAMVLGDTLSQTPHPDTAYLYCYPMDGQELQNPTLTAWTNGPAAAPDSFTLTGSGASAYRTMANSPKLPNACGLTRAGTDCYLTQALTARQLARAQGRYVSAGAWLYATVASRAYVEIAVTHRDSTTVEVFTSSAHTGGSAYEWIEKEAIYVPIDATAVAIRVSCKTGDTSIEFCAPILAIGSTVAQTPHSKAATAFAFANHNLGTTGRGIKLQYSSDHSSWSDAVAEFTPTTDHVVWRDFASQSAPYWRVAVTGGPNEGIASIGCIAFGEYLELPYYMPAGWDPFQRPVLGETARSNAGNFIGRNMLKDSRKLSIVQEWITEAELETLQPWFSHAGGQQYTTGGTGRGLPFFFQWDDGDHESWSADEKDGGPLFCAFISGQGPRAPLTWGIRVDRLEIPIEAVSM